ncbi:hypothetical protein C8J56DRAFT_521513 [Mycena floridula]|nr:hypothetical protein C8J56DRAFT_521513 [Mycena floridula]
MSTTSRPATPKVCKHISTSLAASSGVSYDFSSPQFPLLNLSTLRSLRYLSLSAPYNQPVTWLCQALQTVVSPELHQVRLVLHGYTPPSADEPWEALDKMLYGFVILFFLIRLIRTLVVRSPSMLILRLARPCLWLLLAVFCLSLFAI